MKMLFGTLLLTIAIILPSTLATAADGPSGPARLDGNWKLDWDRSDSFDPAMRALEASWFLRKLAGVARVGLEMRAVAVPSNCDECAEKITVTLNTPISNKEVEAILDGEPRPGEDARGRATVDRYTWSSEDGLEMIRELELPSGSQARMVEIRDLGEDPDTLSSQLTIWVDGSERASVKRMFIRTSD
jgi:hypothetical protein